jgi:hypothetical protein
MIYISPENEYPRHYGDIIIENPDWKLGDELPDGWVQVAMNEPPSAGTDQVVTEDFPIEIEGILSRNWIVRDLTAEEIEQRDARKNALQKLKDLGFSDLEIQALISI